MAAEGGLAPWGFQSWRTPLYPHRPPSHHTQALLQCFCVGRGAARVCWQRSGALRWGQTFIFFLAPNPSLPLQHWKKGRGDLSRVCALPARANAPPSLPAPALNALLPINTRGSPCASTRRCTGCRSQPRARTASWPAPLGGEFPLLGFLRIRAPCAPSRCTRMRRRRSLGAHHACACLAAFGKATPVVGRVVPALGVWCSHQRGGATC